MTGCAGTLAQTTKQAKAGNIVRAQVRRHISCSDKTPDHTALCQKTRLTFNRWSERYGAPTSRQEGSLYLVCLMDISGGLAALLKLQLYTQPSAPGSYNCLTLSCIPFSLLLYCSSASCLLGCKQFPNCNSASCPLFRRKARDLM